MARARTRTSAWCNFASKIGRRFIHDVILRDVSMRVPPIWVVPIDGFVGVFSAGDDEPYALIGETRDDIRHCSAVIGSDK
jgi:hypothetical protein